MVALVVCKVELNKPVEQEILMVDSAPTAALPAGVFLLILVKNESSREMSIPKGAVICGMYNVDFVATIPP